MMKKTILGIVLLAGLIGWANPCWAGPKATVDGTVHTFEPVMDGSRISHTFVIKNTGDSVLEIKKVEVP